MPGSFNLKKALTIMAAINIMQAIVLISLMVYEIRIRPEATPVAELYSLPIIALLSLIGAVIAIAALRPMLFFYLRLKQTESSISDLNKLNDTLRAQRHDFMNHLQVVHSLIELAEHDEANAYIEKVYANIERVNHVLRTGIPAVNAILEAKRQMCENRNIAVKIDIRSKLDEIPIPPWEFCRVLGNLIDNAIDALAKEDEPQIKIEIIEDVISYKFAVGNNGPSIPPELWKKIFEMGYTTGKAHGEGMGLTICREIMTKYGGNIKVYSNETETVFEGSVPRKRITQVDKNYADGA